MAAIDFPDNPSINDTFSIGGKQWEWDGTAWQLLIVTSNFHASTHASGGTDEITISQSQVTDLETDLSDKQPLDADLTAIAELSASATGLLQKDGDNSWSLDTNTYLTGNETITVSGDATGSGATSISLTLANSGVSASTYGSSSQIPVLTLDSKGRVTSASVESVEGLPSQTENSGKYLTTNGTAASWDTIDLGTDTSGNYVATIAGTANEIEVTGSGSESAAVTLSLPATINANTTGSAASLTTARTISLGGDLSGSASFNGTSDITITAAVADDSHNHVISNVDDLQTALDAKSPLASPTFTGALSVINANSSTIPMAYGSRFGYSTSYKILVIGDTNSSNFNSVGIGYDPISNSSGSFTGNGGEVFFRNAVKFKTPNSSNDGFLTPMEFTSAGVVDIKNDLIVSGGDITLGGTGRIQGIDTVSSGTDAANKNYVDTAVESAGSDISPLFLAGL